LYDYYTDLCITHGRNEDFAKVVLDEFLFKADDALEFLKVTLQNSPEVHHHHSNKSSNNSSIIGAATGSHSSISGKVGFSNKAISHNNHAIADRNPSQSEHSKMIPSASTIHPSQPSIPKPSSPSHKALFAPQPISTTLASLTVSTPKSKSSSKYDFIDSNNNNNNIAVINHGDSGDGGFIIENLRKTVDEQSRVISSQQAMIQSQQQMIAGLMALSNNK